jgi:putative FmdB family regulatory protein
VPVFEYRCISCGAETEAILLHNEAPPDACEACGGELKRRWSRVGVQLVGWGFSKTDSMLPDDGRRKDFKQIRDKASELFD